MGLVSLASFILSVSIELSKLIFYFAGDLHYHLSQHGVFNENEMKFYAAEVILGLEHMHRWGDGNEEKICSLFQIKTNS